MDQATAVIRILGLSFIYAVWGQAARALEWLPPPRSQASELLLIPGLVWEPVAPMSADGRGNDTAEPLPASILESQPRPLAWEDVHPGDEMSPGEVARELQSLDTARQLAFSLLSGIQSENTNLAASWQRWLPAIRECRTGRGSQKLPCLEITRDRTNSCLLSSDVPCSGLQADLDMWPTASRPHPPHPITTLSALAQRPQNTGHLAVTPGLARVATDEDQPLSSDVGIVRRSRSTAQTQRLRSWLDRDLRPNDGAQPGWSTASRAIRQDTISISTETRDLEALLAWRPSDIA